MLRRGNFGDLTDAVEKVGDRQVACNFLLLADSFLNQYSPLCAFLESILHRDPPQNLFSTVSVNCRHFRTATATAASPQSTDITHAPDHQSLCRCFTFHL